MPRWRLSRQRQRHLSRRSAWTASDRGAPNIGSSATAASASRRRCQPARRADIRAIRVHAFDRPPARTVTRPGSVDLTRINKVFMLDDSFLPGKSILHWEGATTIPVGGEPFEVRIP